MIKGIGIDIVKVLRISRLIEKNGTAFLSRIFTLEEIELARTKSMDPEYFAGRWAVKEAVSKALGTGIGKDCRWHDISTVSDSNGKPELLLSGNAAQQAKGMGITRFHCSISHEKDFALANVILEGE